MLLVTFSCFTILIANQHMEKNTVKRCRDRDGMPKRMQTGYGLCMKAKINILANPHPYISFTLLLNSAGFPKMYHKFSFVPRPPHHPVYVRLQYAKILQAIKNWTVGRPGNETTTSSQHILAVYGCSLVLRPLPPHIWPGNEASMI